MSAEVVFPLLCCWRPLSIQDYGLWLLWNFGLFVLVFCLFVCYHFYSSIRKNNLKTISINSYVWFLAETDVIGALSISAYLPTLLF